MRWIKERPIYLFPNACIGAPSLPEEEEEELHPYNLSSEWSPRKDQ